MARPNIAAPVIPTCEMARLHSLGYRTRRGFDPASNTAISAFSAKLRTILETSLPIRDGARNELEPRMLSLSDDARELLTQYYENTEREQVSDGDLAHVRAYASKSTEQAARIAGVLTLWENQQATEVQTATMGQGISLAQFYLSEASRLADSAVISLDIERADLLRKWLLEKWHEQEILPREIMHDGPNSLRESPTARTAISLLEKHGWLVALPEGALIRGSNRKEAYRIVRPANVV